MKSILVIPTYNCESQISRLVQKSSKTINAQFDEIVIIDNGSTDKTLDNAINELKVIDTKVKVLQNKKNLSLGGSLKTGFIYAKENRYDLIAILHGDDQANLDDLLPMIEKMKIKNIDLAIGARFHSKSELIGYSAFRRVGNRLLNRYCILCTGTKIDDLIAGLNLFRVSELNLDEVLNYPDNLTFDVHVLLRAIDLKQSIEFFPITWREEDQISNAKVVRQAVIILRLFTTYFFKREQALKFQKTQNTYRDYRVVFERR